MERVEQRTSRPAALGRASREPAAPRRPVADGLSAPASASGHKE